MPTWLVKDGNNMDFDPKDPRFNHCLKKDIEHYKKYLKEKKDLTMIRHYEIIYLLSERNPFRRKLWDSY